MMENLLFVLALAGIVLGGYSLFAPSLRKRGWSLPLMHFFDDEEDEDDVGTDDLDQPFDKALAAKQQKALKEPKAQKAPKPAKAPKVKKQRGKDADTLAFTPASSLEMSPLTPRPPRKLVLDGDEEEIDPRIVIERPNAGADAEIELDPELQALVDSVADGAKDAVAVGAGSVEATSAATSMAIDTAAAAPSEEKKPESNFGDNMLDLFGDDEIEDTKPAALREALELCSMDQLREEAAAMRAILTSLGQSAGQHAA